MATLNRLKLDQRTQDLLQELLFKDIDKLTKSDIAFLRARRDYLTSDELESLSEKLEKKSKPSKNKNK